MEKVTISLSFEKEKLDAMAVFLADEHTTVQKKLEASLQQLYEQTVPDDVRKFVEVTSGGKPRRAAPAKPRTAPKAQPTTKKEVTVDGQPGDHSVDG